MVRSLPVGDGMARDKHGPVPASAVRPPAHSAVPAGLRPEHLYKAVGLAFLAAVVYRFFDEIFGVLLTIYAAAILAVALNIIVGLFPRQRKWVAAGLGLAVLGGIAAALWVGIPAFASQVRGVAERIPELDGLLRDWSAWLSDRTGLNIQLVGSGARGYLERIFTGVNGGDMLGRATGVVDFFVIPLLVLVGALYGVANPNDRLLTPVLRAVPRDRRLAFRRLLELLGDRLRGWVAGTLISMLAVGVLTTVALYLVGARYALLLGTLNGLLEFVPILGPWVGGAIAVGVTFLDNPSLAFWVFVIVVAIQQIESNLITPLVMAKAAEVHPFVTVFAIFLFGAIFGFMGILLALPIVIMLWTVIEVLWVERTIDTDEDRIEPVVE